MGKIFIIAITFIFITPNLNSQSLDSIVFRVANNIIENTSYKIINSKTGELFDYTKKLPVSSDYKVESPYNEWKYWNGVLALGMLELGKISGEYKYTEYTLNNYEFIFKNLDYFEKQYQKKIKKSSFYLYFRMSRLDDCGAMAMGLCDVYNLNPKKEYMQYLQRTANFIQYDEVRLEDSTIVRPKPRKMTLWADDLYMSVPFLVKMFKISGNEDYLNDAIHQAKKFNEYLFNANNQLYFHSWYSDNNQNGVAHWGRCNGWVLMAQAELLNVVPENHPERQYLISIFQQHVVGLSRHQDYSGLWHQVIDKQDSYLESSATAMFVYSIARAVNQGWIDISYADVATEGWKGLAEKINDSGQVESICIGTGIKDYINFYYDRPTKLNDIHGLGAVLLAGVEMIKLEAFLKTKEEEKQRLKAERLNRIN